MNISVIGTGYVGLVAGSCFAEVGHDVMCADLNAERIATLHAGRVPFFEPGLDEVFGRNRARLQFTSTVANAVNFADVIFVAVGTPERADGGADMEPTFKVLADVAAHADRPKFVVLKSTVPIGTAAKAKAFLRTHARVSMHVISNPEFLRQGTAVEDFLRPDRVVIGCADDGARAVMRELYASFLDEGGGRGMLFMDNVSAEMVKYAANSFLALKISFANELALLADAVGAEIDGVRAGFTSDHRINPAFFAPGIGYGGSCFPKDVRALIHTARENNLELLTLKAADAVNERQKTVLVDRVVKRLGSVRGRTIALWGLAFKAQTDDVRRAPSLKIMEQLFLRGASLRAFDPVASDNARRASSVPFVSCETPMDTLNGADALLILTEWPEFHATDWTAVAAGMRRPLVFDGRNIFDPETLRDFGIEYYGIGRGARPREVATARSVAAPESATL